MGLVIFRKQAQRNRREIAQVIDNRALDAVPHGSVTRKQHVVLDFRIPNGRGNGQRIIQVGRFARLGMHDKKRCRDIKVGIRRASIVHNIIGEAERNPGSQGLVVVRPESTGIIPQGIEHSDIALDSRNKHTVADAFRHGATAVLHLRFRRFINLALGCISATLGCRPDNSCGRQILFLENMTELVRNFAVVCRFLI